MNARAILMIVVSLLAGLIAMVLAARWLSQQSSLSVQKVAVAAADLDVGHPLGADHVRLVDWPRGSVPQGAFTDAASLAGRVTKINVLRDEPILESKLAPQGTKGGLSAVIADGKRAITVKVNEVVGVAGFALPGNYVDVMVNTLEGDGGGPRNKQNNISKIVLERILVLAVAQEASRDATKPKVVSAVTLEVTPPEAEKLDLARSVGTLSLVLRNQVEDAPVTTTGATKDTLLSLKQPGPQASRVVVRTVQVSTTPPLVRRKCIDVITGVRKTEECF